MLRLFPRYLLRETLGLYAIGVATFCLMLSIDTLTVWAGYLIEQNASFISILQLMVYRLPFFLHLSLPVASVFAVLLATGRLAKDSELKAAYASGIAPITLLWPLLALGLGISAIATLNNGFLEPRGEVAQQKLVEQLWNGIPNAAIQQDTSFIQERGVYHAARIQASAQDRSTADLTGVLVYGNDGTVWSAPYGTWNSRKKTWRLNEVQVLAPGKRPVNRTQVVLPFNLRADAGEALKDAKTLTLGQLGKRINAARAAGQNVEADIFGFHRRLADASSAFIFVLIASALGLTLRGRSAGFAWTIVLIVVFFVLWTLSESFFEQGVLGPVMAAWLTTLITGAVGSLLAFIRLR